MPCVERPISGPMRMPYQSGLHGEDSGDGVRIPEFGSVAEDSGPVEGISSS